MCKVFIVATQCAALGVKLHLLVDYKITPVTYTGNVVFFFWGGECSNVTNTLV
jgi:hypothetical protein